MAYGNYAPFYRGGFFNPMQTPTMPQIADNQGQYAPQYQPQTNSSPIPMNTQPTNDMIWVLNETEATSYPVAPNNSVTLWDKNQDTVYIKSVNMQGIPSMRILDYAERTAENAPKTHAEHICQCGDKFVSVDTFKALQNEFEALRNELEELKSRPRAKTSKKIVEEADNE